MRNEFESKVSVSGLAQFHQAFGFAPLVHAELPVTARRVNASSKFRRIVGAAFKIIEQQLVDTLQLSSLNLSVPDL